LGALIKGNENMLCAKSCASISRWIAKIGSLIVVGFLLILLFGEGLPPISILHLCFPLGVMLGLIVGWFFEGIGSTITIVSIAAFYLIHYRLSGKLPGGPFFLIAAAPSVLFLISKFMRQDMATETEYDAQ